MAIERAGAHLDKRGRAAQDSRNKPRKTASTTAWTAGVLSRDACMLAM